MIYRCRDCGKRYALKYDECPNCKKGILMEEDPVTKQIITDPQKITNIDSAVYITGTPNNSSEEKRKMDPWLKTGIIMWILIFLLLFIDRFESFTGALLITLAISGFIYVIYWMAKYLFEDTSGAGMLKALGGLLVLALVLFVPSISKAVFSGTHSSPRPHYRRGTTVHTKNGEHYRRGTWVDGKK